MLLIIVACLIYLSPSHGQSLSRGRNSNQMQERGFPLILPEKGVNPNVDEKTIADAVQAFAHDLSIGLWEKQILGNVIFSPLSIEALMGLLLLGTRGVTYQQLKNALFFPENATDSTIHESFQYVLGQLEGSSPSVELDISSILFAQRGIPVSDTYKQIAQALYDANVVDINFRDRPLRSLTQINQFVRRATRGKIPQLLKAPPSGDTLMIAVNAIYFNGPWEFPFNKDETKFGVFDTGKQRKNVEMMHNVMRVPFVNRRDLGFDMVSLPYLDSDLSLYILTPVGTAGIASLINLESGLFLISLDNLIKQMKTTFVDVTIPKMKLQYRHNLKSHLQDLGATSIFTPKRSNFGRMTTETNFGLKDVIHEATIEVTETGTVAAAATATTINRFKPEVFRADKPSILFIRDNSNGIIIFWGRVVDP